MEIKKTKQKQKVENKKQIKKKTMSKGEAETLT